MTVVVFVSICLLLIVGQGLNALVVNHDDTSHTNTASDQQATNDIASHITETKAAMKADTGVAYTQQKPRSLRKETIIQNSIYRTVGRVGDECTGVLIENDFVLTSAHCLYNEKDKRRYKNFNGFYDHKYFHMGKDCTTNSVQEREIDEYIMYKKYYDYNGPDEFDIALLKLKRLQTYSITPMQLSATQPGSYWGNENIMIVGYMTPQGSEDCMYKWQCSVESHLSRDILAHGCKTEAGTSGAPVIHNGKVVAVHMAGWNQHGREEDSQAVLLTEAHVTVIKNWISGVYVQGQTIVHQVP